MDPLDILSKLKELRGGFFEWCHTTTFRCYQDREIRGTFEVTVTILDGGPGATGGRYRCVAKSEDGATATGNPDDNLDVVLATVHWGDLDDPVKA